MGRKSSNQLHLVMRDKSGDQLHLMVRDKSGDQLHLMMRPALPDEVTLIKRQIKTKKEQGDRMERLFWFEDVLARCRI